MVVVTIVFYLSSLALLQIILLTLREVRLALLYKVVFSFVAESANDIGTDVLIKSDSRTRARHDHKFKQIWCNTTAYAQLFFPRTVRDWNVLSGDSQRKVGGGI